jgi:biofilm PGA synthesis N-glycosyltransferase PgaC
MSIFEYIAVFFAGIYFIFFLWLAIGYYGTLKMKIPRDASSSAVTLIIPVKNEESNLPVFFESLKKQKNVNGEIIFVNDHSEDDSLHLMKNFSHDVLEVKVIELAINERGKKTAIEKAVFMAKNEVIITTDADMIFSESWMEQHSKKFSKEYILAGPIAISSKRGFWNTFQQLEMMAIQLICSGMNYWRKPIALSAASMSFPKEMFLRLNPYRDNKEELSGDDIYLLLAAKKHNIPVYYDQNREFVAETPGKDFGQYLGQHIRWMKKKSSFRDVSVILTGLLLFFSSAWFLFSVVYQCFMNEVNLFMIFSLAVKTIVDFLLLFLIVREREKLPVLAGFVYSFPISILINLLIPFFGWLIPVKWKGRRI